MDSRQDELSALFALGVPMARLHYFDELTGLCSCKNVNCGKNIGKHPMEFYSRDNPKTNVKKGQVKWLVREDAKQLNNCNVGIRCGNPIVVVDIDPRNGGTEALAALEAKHGPLPRTWEVATGGGGRHRYYRALRENHAGGAIAPGGAIDLKGHGGYVVGPTSIHASGRRYEWEVPPGECELAPLPEWIDKIQTRVAVQEHDKRESELSFYNDEDIVDALMHIPVDSVSREEWRSIGMGLYDRGFTSEVWAKWSETSPKYKGRASLEKQWKGFTPSDILAKEGKKAVTVGTLIKMAEKRGWIFGKAYPTDRWELNPSSECEPTVPTSELKSGENEGSQIDTRKIPERESSVSVISHNEEPIASDDQNDLWEDPNDVPYLYEIASCINMAAMTQNDEAAIDSAEVAVGALGQAHYATPIRHGNICTYALIIGPSGCGKDSFLQAPAKIVKMFNPKIMLGVAQSAAAIRKEFYREPSRLFVKDEFANFLLRLGNKSDPLNACEGDYLELWSATTGHVLTGFSNKKDEDDSKEVVDGRCSIIGACTIAGLDEVMKKNSSFLSEGLGGRFRLCIFTGGKANSPFSHDGTLTLSPDIMRRLTMISIGGREESLVKRPMEVQATKTKTGENKDDKKKESERGEIVTRTIYPVRSDVQFDGFLADQDGQRGEAAELYKKYHEKFRIDPNNTSRCTVSDSLMARVPDKALRLATKEAILANPTPGESRVTLPMMRFALARTIRQTKATIETFTTTVGVVDEVKIRTAILAYLKGKVSSKNPNGEMKWGSVVQSSRAMKPSPTVNSDMVARIRDRMQDEGLIVIIKGKSKNGEAGFRIRLP